MTRGLTDNTWYYRLHVVLQITRGLIDYTWSYRLHVVLWFTRGLTDDTWSYRMTRGIMARQDTWSDR